MLFFVCICVVGTSPEHRNTAAENVAGSELLTERVPCFPLVDSSHNGNLCLQRPVARSSRRNYFEYEPEGSSNTPLSQHMYIEVVHGFIVTWGSEELGDSSIRDQTEACVIKPD